MITARSNAGAPRERPPKTLVVASVLVVLAILVSGGVLLARDAGLRFVSGVWTALAVDAAHGVLYRPVMGPLGYGGSRYMPLHFVLHGALIRWIGDPLVAGTILTAGSALGLLTGVYALLRALGVARNWAACGTALSLGSVAGLLAVTSIRGDLLPAALNVWGLACLARQLERQQVRVRVPGLLFLLAFSAKTTTLFGLAAAITVLLSQGKKKPAARLAGMTVAGIPLIALLMYVASNGRVFESMRVTGTGGAGVANLLVAPWTFLQVACFDVAFLPFLLAAATALLLMRGGRSRDLAAQWLLWTFVVTVCIFGSPGTDFNHLLDLHVAGVTFLVTRYGGGRLPRFSRAVFSAAGFIAAAVLIVMSVIVLNLFPIPLQQDQREAFKAARGETGPVLSEDPWVPVAGGERPYLLDPFNLRLACARDPRVRQDLWAKLERHYFSGVVLTPMEEPFTAKFDMDGTWRGIPYYGGLHFPPGFIDQLYRYYQPVKRIHSYLILKPRD